MLPPGKIIFINGASSSGKSTLCRALQTALPEPFWHFSIDHLITAKVLPDRGRFAWSEMRPAFFEGFHHCLPALALAGNNLLVEHIVETQEWMDRLVTLLAPFDVFYIGLHCPLEELERREIKRGDRPIGDTRNDFGIIHSFGAYDLELDSTELLEENVARHEFFRSCSSSRTHHKITFTTIFCDEFKSLVIYVYPVQGSLSFGLLTRVLRPV